MRGAIISGPIASISKRAISFNGHVPFVGNARFPRLYCLLKQARSRQARYEFAAAALAKIAALATNRKTRRRIDTAPLPMQEAINIVETLNADLNGSQIHKAGPVSILRPWRAIRNHSANFQHHSANFLGEFCRHRRRHAGNVATRIIFNDIRANNRLVNCPNLPDAADRLAAWKL
jgi:hypothetical protein